MQNMNVVALSIKIMQKYMLKLPLRNALISFVLKCGSYILRTLQSLICHLMLIARTNCVKFSSASVARAASSKYTPKSLVDLSNPSSYYFKSENRARGRETRREVRHSWPLSQIMYQPKITRKINYPARVSPSPSPPLPP